MNIHLNIPGYSLMKNASFISREFYGIAAASGKFNRGIENHHVSQVNYLTTWLELPWRTVSSADGCEVLHQAR